LALGSGGGNFSALREEIFSAHWDEEESSKPTLGSERRTPQLQSQHQQQEVQQRERRPTPPYVDFYYRTYFPSSSSVDTREWRRHKRSPMEPPGNVEGEVQQDIPDLQRLHQALVARGAFLKCFYSVTLNCPKKM